MKRWCARLLVALLLAAGLIPLTAGASWACSCGSLQLTEAQEYRSVAIKAPRIYIATVVGRTGGPVVDANGNQGVGTYRYAVRVVRSLKGQVSGMQHVTTATNGAACGAFVNERRPLLVYSTELSSCGGFTQERVQERAAIVRSALRGDPVVHVVARGEWLWQIARSELQVQSRTFSNPSAAAVSRAAQRIYRANRTAIGPRPDRLEIGTRLRIPRLVVLTSS